MDQLVELEPGDLAGVKPYEPLPDMLKQQPQLLLVITPDQLARRPALGMIVSPLVASAHAADTTSSRNGYALNVDRDPDDRFHGPSTAPADDRIGDV